jgi:hypothetical protein
MVVLRSAKDCQVSCMAKGLALVEAATVLVVVKMTSPPEKAAIAMVGAWTEHPPMERLVNIFSQTKHPLNISPQVPFCPSDILSPIYNDHRFYVYA